MLSHQKKLASCIFDELVMKEEQSVINAKQSNKLTEKLKANFFGFLEKQTIRLNISFYYLMKIIPSTIRQMKLPQHRLVLPKDW